MPEPERRGEMLCRLVMQIHATGVLFLVLPRRCVNSPAVGEAHFEALLTGLGCVHLLPKRVTPRIVFYVLGRRSDKPGSSSHLITSSSSSKSSTTMHSKPDCSESWEQDICELMRLYMDKKTLQHFSSQTKPKSQEENSHLEVQPFSLSLPTKYLSRIVS